MGEARQSGESPLFEGEPAGDEGVSQALRAHYTKHEHRIPMRDGTRLFTAIYAPKDRSRRYPFLLLRSPFGIAPYGEGVYPTPENTLARLGPLGCYVQDGYIFVYQDVRGRMASGGEFVHMRPYLPGKRGTEFDESSDAHDTIDWLLRSVEGHSGRVGVWGISYPGFYAAQAAIDAHPALAAVSAQAPATEWFLGDDFHHHGAFLLAPSFGFTASLARTERGATQIAWSFEHGAGDVYDFFLQLGPLASADARYFHGGNQLWDDLMAHGTRDAYWRARDPRPHYRDIRPPVLITGGWFDEADLFGTLETYRVMLAQSPQLRIHLAMGPWGHGGWMEGDGDRLGDLAFGSPTALTYRARIEHPFFRHYLKGIGSPPPKVSVFETGADAWRDGDLWPPPGARPLTFWFHPAGALRREPPGGAAETSFDEYVSDPANPVPCCGRAVPALEGDFMVEDQRFASRRPDVLAYQTGELEADLALAGPLEASLWVSTTGTDADFVVKLIDVHPGSGCQRLVRGWVMRGKFRNSYEAPEPFRPGEPALVRFAIPDVSHTFRAGHRLMVQVQSSWFPLVDRNPQTFVDIYGARPSDFRAATHRLHRTPGLPSGITVTARVD